jgi:hypothetical protein
MMMKKIISENPNNKDIELFNAAKQSLCLQSQEIIDYINNELDELNRVRVELHLQRCLECQSRLAWYQEPFDIKDYEYSPELIKKFQKLLDLIPVAPPEPTVQSTKNKTLSFIIPWISFAPSFAAHDQDQWQTFTPKGFSAEQIDVGIFWDSADNLILRFTLAHSHIENEKELHLRTENLDKSADLQKDGQRWFAEIRLENEEREKLINDHKDVLITLEE